MEHQKRGVLLLRLSGTGVLSDQGPTYDLRGIAYGNGTWVAVGSAAYGHSILTSSDGVNWINRNPPTGNDLNAVTYGNELFVAVGRANSYGVLPDYRAIVTSRDGSSWSGADLGWTTYELFGVAGGGGTYVASGFLGKILTSTNGNWSVQKSPTQNYLRAMAFGGGSFVGVGDTHTIVFSDDGINWTPWPGLEVLGPAGFSGVVYGTNKWVVVGDSGIAWFYNSDTGDNGVMALPTGKQSLRGIAYGGGYFVAVGDAETIVTSADGISWNAQNSGAQTDLRGVAYGNGRFVAVGAQGTILLSGDLNGTTGAMPALTINPVLVGHTLNLSVSEVGASPWVQWVGRA